jgi:Mg2+ and Co2+ transporter CorA
MIASFLTDYRQNSGCSKPHFYHIGRLRKQKTDYLMYALVDTVIDFGFPMLETYSEQIQALEDELMETKNERLLSSIHELRREILLIRRRLWPQREVINELLRADDSQLLQENTHLHLRDCHDHVISIMEMLETYHEMTSGLMELYLTSVSLKLNDVTPRIISNKLTFEYDIMLDKTALNNEIRQSYGMGIVRKLQNAPTFK